MRDHIDQAIARDQIDALAVVLDGAKASEIRYAARRIGESTTEPLALRAQALAGHREVGARLVACRLAENAYERGDLSTPDILRLLANDADWTVRDAAAEACGRLLRKKFARMLEVLRDWRTDDAQGVRRAVIIAAFRAAQPRHPEWAEPLLKLLEPLLEDRNPSVRRFLGPSALGTSLLRHYPMVTFEYLVRWSTSNDPQVLWNVAMAFTAPAAGPIVKKAIIVLRKLSLDERRYVWRAAASAMWQLGRRRPEIVRPELARWIEDERRVDVAREALKHI